MSLTYSTPKAASRRAFALTAALLALTAGYPAAACEAAQALAMPGSDDTFAAAGLRRPELAKLFAEVARTAFDTPESWTSELRVRRIESGGESYLIVRGTDLLCGGTGACELWLFIRRGGRWSNAIADEAPVVEWVCFGADSSHGRRDLIAVTGGCLATYRFDGHAYRVASTGRGPACGQGGPAPTRP
jgi:hypothetical protein